jgi:transcriptional regulator with XRE-family HTH domain
MIDLAFARTLKKLRLAKGLSQEDFGSEAGLHRTYVSQLERGLKSPSLKTLCKVSEVLGIQMSELLRHVEDELKHVSAH